MQQRLRQNGLELIAQGSGPLFGGVELFQQLFRVTVIVCDSVGVLEIEIVVRALISSRLTFQATSVS